MCIRLQQIFDYDFLSDCPSLLHGITIRYVQHCQTVLERGVCELAHSSFIFFLSETSSADFDASKYRSFLKEKGVLGEGCWLREGLTPSDEVQSHRYGNRSFCFWKIKTHVKQFKLV